MLVVHILVAFAMLAGLSVRPCTCQDSHQGVRDRESQPSSPDHSARPLQGERGLGDEWEKKQNCRIASSLYATRHQNSVGSCRDRSRDIWNAFVDNGEEYDYGSLCGDYERLCTGKFDQFASSFRDVMETCRPLAMDPANAEERDAMLLPFLLDFTLFAQAELLCSSVQGQLCIELGTESKTQSDFQNDFQKLMTSECLNCHDGCAPELQRIASESCCMTGLVTTMSYLEDMEDLKEGNQAVSMSDSSCGSVSREVCYEMNQFMSMIEVPGLAYSAAPSLHTSRTMSTHFVMAAILSMAFVR